MWQARPDQDQIHFSSFAKANDSSPVPKCIQLFSLSENAEGENTVQVWKARPNQHQMHFSSQKKCFRAASARPCLLGCLCFVTVCKQIKFKSNNRNRAVFCGQQRSHIHPRACQMHLSLPAGCIWQRFPVVLHSGVHCARPLKLAT